MSLTGPTGLLGQLTKPPAPTSRTARHTDLSDPRAVSWLLRMLREGGATYAATVPASWAADRGLFGALPRAQPGAAARIPIRAGT